MLNVLGMLHNLFFLHLGPLSTPIHVFNTVSGARPTSRAVSCPQHTSPCHWGTEPEAGGHPRAS